MKGKGLKIKGVLDGKAVGHEGRDNAFFDNMPVRG